MKIILALFFFPIIHVSSAQTFTTFTGSMFDNVTNLPIPWAHVKIQNSSVGTITNLEGKFLLSVPHNLKQVMVQISCIGFKTKIQILNEGDDEKIFLEQDDKLLSEVVVRPKDVRAIIREAIKKIPQNYSSLPAVLNGFYRESLQYDSSHYIYVSEGVLKARKESYQEPHETGQIKLIKSRKMNFPDSLGTMNKFRFYAGPHTQHDGDFVMAKKEFINESKLQDYDYVIVEIVYKNGSEVYKITFKPNKPSGLFEGTIYLEVGTGAFISAHYRLTQAGVKKSREPFELHARLIRAERFINYMKIGNRWFLQNTWSKSRHLLNSIKDTVVFQSEFVTTEVDTVNIAPFRYAERLQYRDIFFDKANNADAKFWDGYTIIKEDSFLEQLQNRKLNQVALNTQFSDVKKAYDQKGKGRLIKVISRLSFDVAALSFFPTHSSSNVTLIGNNFGLASHIGAANGISFGGYTGLNYQRSKRFSFGLNFMESFGKLHFVNSSFGMGYHWQVSIKTRPLKFKLGFDGSANSLSMPIGTIQGPQFVNGENLSNEIEVMVQKKFFALQPAIKIALELNGRWDLFLKASYLFELGTANRIWFQEKDGFFLTRSEASLKVNDPSIDFKVNGVKASTSPLSIAPLFVHVGFTYCYLRR